MGELGQEIVVDPRTGMWYTVGDSGAEFVNIPKNAIVFNHKQTQSLLANGFVSGRATALVGGTAAVTGGIKVSQAKKSSAYNEPVKKKSSSSNTATKSYNKSSKNNGSGSSKSSSTTTKDFEETFDWVEIALNRISEAIDRVKTKAESVYKALTTKNSALGDEMALLSEKIELQNQAYSQYMAQANSVGLSGEWQEKVKNGSIELSKITDEDLADKIKDFQDFYEKAIEAKDAIADLHEEIAKLYKDKFDNVSDKYEGDLALLGHITNVYKTGMDTLQAQGYKGSTVYYKALQKAETESIGVLKEELKSMIDAYSEAMNSGEIEKGSSAWYDMQKAINSVKESIQDAELSLLQYEKSMRELNWEYFDYMEDRISNITDEADFLIDLMANGKLFDDKGQMTDTGMATMGLHGQNYNVDMAQADQYAKGFDANRVQSIVNQMGREGYVRSGAWVGRYQGIRDLSPYHYNKYAVGLKNAPKAENAWVNELGNESIVKPSENAIVTHIAKGDSVLTADATRNIWDMASDPSDFISKNLFSNGVRSDVEPRVYVDNRKIGEVEFNLPNVLNYEDFMRRMQRDNKFEGMIQDMTIGIVAGKSSLAKNKYRW